MKPVNIVLGRFQPYTKGHQACVDAAFDEVGLKTVLCIIETPDNKVDERHPFPTSMLIPWIEKMMHGGSHIQDYVLVKNADIAKIAEALHDKGYELASWTCGTDRYPAYSRQCKGYWEKVGLPEEPKCIEVKRGDDDVSATKAREALKNNDEKAYDKLMTSDWRFSTFTQFRHQLLKVVENQNRYNMKPLTEYMMEALKQEFVQFSLDDLENWDVWHANDELSHKDLVEVGTQFYKKYPADMNDCGTVAGYSVKCDVGQTAMRFTVYYGNAPEKDKIKVIEEIVDFLCNVVYSVGPGKGAKQLIKAMLNKI